MEEILPYGYLLFENNPIYKSIGFDLQRNRIPLRWFSNISSKPKYLSIIQFIHRLFLFRNLKKN